MVLWSSDLSDGQTGSPGISQGVNTIVWSVEAHHAEVIDGLFMTIRHGDMLGLQGLLDIYLKWKNIFMMNNAAIAATVLESN